MIGINPGEFLVLLLVALIVVGPERLPRYAQQLGKMVRDGRKMAMGLREQVRGELGPEFDEVDWQKLDPRQYDPRKIIRDALSDTLDEDAPKAVSEGGPKPVRKPARPGSAGSPAAVAAKARPRTAAASGTAPAGTTAAAAASPSSAPDGSAAQAADQTPDQGTTADTAQPADTVNAVPAARTAGGAPVDLEAT